MFSLSTFCSLCFLPVSHLPIDSKSLSSGNSTMSLLPMPSLSSSWLCSPPLLSAAEALKLKRSPYFTHDDTDGKLNVAGGPSRIKLDCVDPWSKELIDDGRSRGKTPSFAAELKESIFPCPSAECCEESLKRTLCAAHCAVMLRSRPPPQVHHSLLPCILPTAYIKSYIYVSRRIMLSEMLEWKFNVVTASASARKLATIKSFIFRNKSIGKQSKCIGDRLSALVRAFDYKSGGCRFKSSLYVALDQSVCLMNTLNMY